MATMSLDSMHPPRALAWDGRALWRQPHRKACGPGGALLPCPRDVLSHWGAGDNQKWGPQHLLPSFPDTALPISHLCSPLHEVLCPSLSSVWWSHSSWWHWNQSFRFSAQLSEGSGSSQCPLPHLMHGESNSYCSQSCHEEM